MINIYKISHITSESRHPTSHQKPMPVLTFNWTWIKACF